MKNIPTATYRLQLNHQFTFKDATAIVDYLCELGISHLYVSPILKARPGSMHGYDIIDHHQLNDEIGTRLDFDELVAALRKHDMGLIVDFVPNHMGVGPDNPWWMDVLENGKASRYADYFDIDWQPVKRELEGKVLIPILGDAYGRVLEGGQLQVEFDEAAGTLAVVYFEHRFPLNPVSYTQVLGLHVDELKARMGEEDADFMEFMSILNAFESLLDHSRSEGFAERVREKTVQCKRLAKLCARNGQIRAFLKENVERFHPQAEEVDRIQRLHSLLEGQAYRLAFWKVAFDEINYRRFFDVNDLAAIRTEDEGVFEDIHALIFELIADGKIDGLRIDHPDGLFDPETYFKRLQLVAAQRVKASVAVAAGAGTGAPGPAAPPAMADATGAHLPLYVVAEKILAPFEQLEEPWMVHGTTGYDFLDAVNNVLVDEDNEGQFTQLYEDFAGSAYNYESLKRDCKRLTLGTTLASELNMLAHRLSNIAESSWFFRDFTLGSLKAALGEVVVHFPVYRTYAGQTRTADSVRQYVDWAVALAKRNSTLPPDVFDFIAGVLRMDLSADSFGATRKAEASRWQTAFAEFAMKFQQFTGPVTAKSVEDTLFYRYARFVALNEVGSEPKRFGISAAAFHYQNARRQQTQPFSLLATSTHDTKRSEDVRARLAVLSEVPRLWRSTVERWQRQLQDLKPSANDMEVPDANDEYFLYQNLVGIFPAQQGDLEAVRERLKQYMVKALREAKRHTSWVQQNQEYEEGLAAFIDAMFADTSFLADLHWFVGKLGKLGEINSLVQTTLKLTSPGIPDIYQGNELFDFSLVDPDNRRAVDFSSRQALLALAGSGSGISEPAARSQGAMKLLLTQRLLNLRKAQPELLREGDYIALVVEGKQAPHIIAFARRFGSQWAVVAVPLKVAALLGKDESVERFFEGDPLAKLAEPDVWQDTVIELPDALSTNNLHNVLTGRKYAVEGRRLPAAGLFQEMPAAVLLP